MKKLYGDSEGQAVAEFSLALLVLLPLVLWMFRFGDLLNLSHKAIEAARLTTWENAYGRSEVSTKELAFETVQSGALFSEPSNLRIKVEVKNESPQENLGAMLDFPKTLSLAQENYYTGEIEVKGKLLLGVPYTLNRKAALLADPWNLTDHDGDARLTDKDLKKVLEPTHFWIPYAGSTINSAIRSIVNAANNGIIKNLASWAGQNIDIDPMGNPSLDQVPGPSGN